MRIVFDVNGVATARADFEPFGELFTVPDMPGGQLPAQQFTGQERDPEASADYFGARFYTPRTGRFSQVDPVYAGLFDPQQWNRYGYARNNPLTFIDPDGLTARAAPGEPGGFSCADILAINANDSLCAKGGGGTSMPGTGAAFGVPQVTTQTAAFRVSKERREPGERASYLAGMVDDFLDAQPPGDALMIEGMLFLIEENAKNLLTAPFVILGTIGKGVGVLPGGAQTLTKVATVYQRLRDYHGIDSALASERLHQIKAAAGFRGNDNVLFDLTGNVYDPRTGAWLGSLTAGGAKRRLR